MTESSFNNICPGLCGLRAAAAALLFAGAAAAHAQAIKIGLPVPLTGPYGNEAADASPYTFHEALNPHITAQAVGRYVFKKGMRVAFLTADYAYGQEMTRGFTRVAKEVGAEVVGEVKHPLGQSDYSTFLPRL